MKVLPPDDVPNARSKQPLKFATLPLVAIPLVLLLTTIPIQWRGGLWKLSGLVPGIHHGSMSRCNLFEGKWIPYDGRTYYDSSSCSLIIDQVNCFKFGRPDSEFLRWRWKPDGCDLPLFDARGFLELARGKSMAFVGDSLGRNQMNSLQCLLSSVRLCDLSESPKDLTKEYRDDPYFPRWYFPSYNFTLTTLWAPFLVKSVESDPNSQNSIVSLWLDEPNESWTSEIDRFDFIILSAGIWLFRPLLFYENGSVVGCNWDSCENHNMSKLGRTYGFQKVFRTTFATLLQKEYKGVTVFRTYSPQHFENGRWNTGGTCTRTEPFTSLNETASIFDRDETDAYQIPVEEFKVAEKVAIERRLKLRFMDTTKMMLLRPDGHPNFYRNTSQGNASIADCVHWCLPGPIDALNEILQYYLIST
ncbi:hypothetical protein MLD38_034706 [Melastoma candidum]|uniref:Uncharacterized protein n=1 Tax=Melastoma candidum TaxID=119954 RepID=A0ACB9MAS4_9MYRT|nr:hypothetical protein MLD38_034706 [Melastoma candidum]